MLNHRTHGKFISLFIQITLPVEYLQLKPNNHVNDFKQIKIKQLQSQQPDKNVVYGRAVDAHPNHPEIVSFAVKSGEQTRELR